jgi:hypothetical protein
MGWTSEGSYGQVLSFLHVVQTDFGVDPASYTMATGSSIPGGKAAEAWS